MKVYLLTTGEYSDYTVQGVFTERGVAEAFREMFCAGEYDYGRVQEMELDPARPSDDESMHSVRLIGPDWVAQDQYAEEGLPWHDARGDEYYHHRNHGLLPGEPPVFSTHVRSRRGDRDAAVKIAMERLARWREAFGAAWPPEGHRLAEELERIGQGDKR